LSEHGANLPQDVKDAITNAQADVRSAAEGEDAEKLRDAINTLQQAVMKIGEALNAGSSSSGAASEGNTYEGEEVKGDEDKNSSEQR
jgi:L1 cell adhesion molecule like protein